MATYKGKNISDDELNELIVEMKDKLVEALKPARNEQGELVVGYIRSNDLSSDSSTEKMNDLRRVGIFQLVKEEWQTPFDYPIMGDALGGILRPGDVLVVHKLSQLFIDLESAIICLEDLVANQVELLVIDNQDCYALSELGVEELLLQLIKLTKEILRNQRCYELELKKATRSKGGRPPVKKELVDRAIKLKERGFPVSEITRVTGISRGSLYRYLGK